MPGSRKLSGIGTLGQLLREDPQTAAEAFEWSRKAAEQGIWAAMFDVAWNYNKGIGVEQNLDLALRWYRKVARLRGDEVSRRNVAVLGGPWWRRLFTSKAIRR
jgi:TPR repeat protein